MVNEKSNVKNWYLKNYKEDDLGNEINDNITFYDVFYALDRRHNIYDTLGEFIDSIVRERIFEKLAEIMNVEYDYIYNQWLLSEED